MKKLFLINLLFLCFCLANAQENEPSSEVSGSEKNTSKDCLEEIYRLKVIYIKEHRKYADITKNIDSLKRKIASEKLVSDNSLDSLKAYNDNLILQHQIISDSIAKKIESYALVCEDVYKNNNIPIDTLFKKYKQFLVPISDKSEEKEKMKTYSYYGNDLVIKDDLFKKESTESKILQKIINEKGEDSYLGDVIIPKNEMELPFYNNEYEKNGRKYLFKKVAIEILDGYFADIKVQVETEDGNTHFFENRIGISLLNFSSFAKKNYLFYSFSTKSKKNNSSYEDTEMEKYRIKLTDVFNYNYKIGNHYVPNNLALEFPMKIKDEDGKLTNAEGPAIHQIKANTDLNNVFELRTYTDFLGLFDDSDNGIVQIEGSADFYISPFPISPGKIELQFFNKLSPIVRFSRLEEESRYYKPNYIIDNQDAIGPSNPIELIEKSYLSMGSNVNIAQLRLRKHFPFTLSAIVPIKYHLTQTKIPNEDEEITKNIKSISVGGGLELNAKRFQNFGYRHRVSYVHYGYEKYNQSILNRNENFLPENQWILSNEAEIFYHTNQNPNNAIFLRLKTFNNYDAKQSFYQLQFGYKFSVGTTKI